MPVTHMGAGCDLDPEEGRANPLDSYMIVRSENDPLVGHRLLAQNLLQ